MNASRKERDDIKFTLGRKQRRKHSQEINEYFRYINSERQVNNNARVNWEYDPSDRPCGGSPIATVNNDNQRTYRRTTIWNVCESLPVSHGCAKLHIAKNDAASAMRINMLLVKKTEYDDWDAKSTMISLLLLLNILLCFSSIMKELCHLLSVTRHESQVPNLIKIMRDSQVLQSL